MSSANNTKCPHQMSLPQKQQHQQHLQQRHYKQHQQQHQQQKQQMQPQQQGIMYPNTTDTSKIPSTVSEMNKVDQSFLELIRPMIMSQVNTLVQEFMNYQVGPLQNTVQNVPAHQLTLI